MEGICVPKSLCSESGRNHESMSGICVLYLEGVCVFDQECEIFFLKGIGVPNQEFESGMSFP